MANAGTIAPASGDAAAGPASLQAAARSSSNEEQSPAGSSAAGSSANHQLEVRHLRRQQLRKIKQSEDGNFLKSHSVQRMILKSIAWRGQIQKAEEQAAVAPFVAHPKGGQSLITPSTPLPKGGG